MPTAATIQAKINRGAAIGAAKIGEACQFYRPTSATNPLATSYATLPVFLTVDAKFSTTTANLFGKPLWYGLFDRTATQDGDYLTGPQGTFYIASQSSLLSTLLVECNRTLSIVRPNADGSGVGSLPPGGQTVATDTTLLTGWPASVLIKTRGEAGRRCFPATRSSHCSRCCCLRCRV